ncbi:MAG: hypothetical protein J0I47_05905 [Sphingomonas sp.]|uniref:hypothetical protein n=1 Tax=Sphingomonas sp. TaxID=28214 RepID=UPI001AC014DC|nr:hypothetical protein [Sphingomonas sp.]MBN8807753.1 hypothetical protein [Sphingomonas sp.]
MLPLIMLAATHAASSIPTCSNPSPTAAFAVKKLPQAVQKALPYRLADPGQPFNVSDAIAKGDEARPFARLICGYPTKEGYVIERERGGRGYSVGSIRLVKTASGYKGVSG